jgi:hypothetical protein
LSRVTPAVSNNEHAGSANTDWGNSGQGGGRSGLTRKQQQWQLLGLNYQWRVCTVTAAGGGVEADWQGQSLRI